MKNYENIDYDKKANRTKHTNNNNQINKKNSEKTAITQLNLY
jgi:hypothetical protein